MLWPAGEDGFFVCFLSSIQAQSSTKEVLFPVTHSPALQKQQSQPPAAHPIECVGLCPDPVLPLPRCCAVTAEPHRGSHWRTMTFHGWGPCSKGPAVAAARVSGTAESSVQTPGPYPMPTTRLHSCMCRETTVNLCSCIVCKVCPFLCAWGAGLA